MAYRPETESESASQKAVSGSGGKAGRVVAGILGFVVDTLPVIGGILFCKAVGIL